MTAKALLFINGVPPKKLPELDDQTLVACTDGAFHYLKKLQFPLEKLDFISGDFDSHTGKDELIYDDKFIFTPDQDKTDFCKVLEILVEKNITEVAVYGGSGGEMDHFLGNLTVALSFKSHLKITFYDEFSMYFFAPNHLTLSRVQNKMISLYPFPFSKKTSASGLQWPLNEENLSLENKISTRNRAIADVVTITFKEGHLIVFIHH